MSGGGGGICGGGGARWSAFCVVVTGGQEATKEVYYLSLTIEYRGFEVRVLAS